MVKDENLVKDLSFKGLYNDKIKDELRNKFNYSNPHQVPKLVKIVLNIGAGREAIADSKVVNYLAEELKLIAAQKPILTTAKKSIAGFKIREGMKIGCKVTLRKERMFRFLERLVVIALPSIRNFTGFSEDNFDLNGNFNFGIKDRSVFCELDSLRREGRKLEGSKGMNITIVTTAKNSQEGKELLSCFGLPFKP